MNYQDQKLGQEFRNYATKHLNIPSAQLDNVENSLTPYILEERQMRVTQMDIFSRLMMDRIIWIAGPINDSVSTVVQAQLLFLETIDKDKDVTLHLDTPGGSVKSGLSIVDMMDYVNYDIATINTGMCASMGSVLLGAGTKGKRSSLRFSKVMTHKVSHGSQGHIDDTSINQIEAEKYNYILFKLLGKYSGKDYKEVMEVSDRDRWFTSEEAKAFGLIDEIIMPKDTLSMSDLLEGFDDYYTEKILKQKLNLTPSAKNS
jgi:ATP-dependent Clp protease protease subunit